MLEKSAPVPQTALPKVNQSAKWNSRIMEKRLILRCSIAIAQIMARAYRGAQVASSVRRSITESHDATP